MAQSLTGVTLTAPASDPNIDAGNTFQMSCTYTQAGHGGEEVVDLYWEYATTSGGPYTPILTSGVLTTTTNPTTGSDSTITHSATITGVTAGTYYVHIRAVGQTSAGSFENGNQVVTVNPGATTTPKTVNASATGTADVSMLKTYTPALDASGVGTASLALAVSRAFDASGVGTADLAMLKTILQDAQASGVGTADLAYGAVLSQAVDATAVGTADVTPLGILGVIAEATATGTADIVRNTGKVFTATATAVGDLLRNIGVLKDTTAVGTADMTDIITLSYNGEVVATGTADVATLGVLGVTAEATAIGTVDLTPTFIGGVPTPQAVNAVAIGTVTLNTQFIAAPVPGSGKTLAVCIGGLFIGDPLIGEPTIGIEDVNTSNSRNNWGRR